MADPYDMPDFPEGSKPEPPPAMMANMTLREYFAGQAMAGYLAAFVKAHHRLPDTYELAEEVVEYADALIAELAK